MCRASGAIYLSCPIFGPPPVAQSAQLLLVVSGDKAAREFVKPLIKPAIGRSIIDVGDDVKKGECSLALCTPCILHSGVSTDMGMSVTGRMGGYYS